MVDVFVTEGFSGPVVKDCSECTELNREAL